jgi:hypothetical protein
MNESRGQSIVQGVPVSERNSYPDKFILQGACRVKRVVNVIDTSLSEWALPDDLTHYIMTTIFEQPRLDSSALIRGRFSEANTRTWLYTAGQYTEISVADHEKFKRAAKSRGGGYSMELCEFIVEEVLADGDVVLNFWRRVRDDTGEGGRVILSRRNGQWTQVQQLGGWENYF